jgi:hypothetical protein
VEFARLARSVESRAESYLFVLLYAAQHRRWDSIRLFVTRYIPWID